MPARLFKKRLCFFMKLADILIILLVTSAGISGILFGIGSSGGKSVIIKTPYGDYRYSLEKDREINVKGLLGNYVVEIKNGRVRAKESNCPEQICVKRGWIHLSGDSIICLPNRIIIKIDNQEQSIDAITE